MSGNDTTPVCRHTLTDLHHDTLRCALPRGHKGEHTDGHGAVWRFRDHHGPVEPTRIGSSERQAGYADGYDRAIKVARAAVRKARDADPSTYNVWARVSSALDEAELAAPPLHPHDNPEGARPSSYDRWAAEQPDETPDLALERRVRDALGYTAEVQPPNEPPRTEYLTDRYGTAQRKRVLALIRGEVERDRATRKPEPPLLQTTEEQIRVAIQNATRTGVALAVEQVRGFADDILAAWDSTVAEADQKRAES